MVKIKTIKTECNYLSSSFKMRTHLPVLVRPQVQGPGELVVGALGPPGQSAGHVGGGLHGGQGEGATRRPPNKTEGPK